MTGYLCERETPSNEDRIYEKRLRTVSMQQIRLLFVDDEPSIRLTLSAILKQRGLNVVTAASVPEALDLINSSKFDALLSDLNIGEPGDGFTVVSAMRRVQPQAATFIITGYPDFESALLAIRNQVDDYLTKPADVNVLVEVITRRLAGREPRNHAVLLRRVSDVLRENVNAICDEWLRAIAANPELAAITLSAVDRIDHIRGVLEELIRKVEGGEDTSEVAARAAAEYGKVRYRQGYSIPQIILEARLLQHTVTATIQANLLGVELSTLISDLVKIGEGLGSILEISVRAYQEQPVSRA
jgi:ActR/RegA family two-component response regulator